MALIVASQTEVIPGYRLLEPLGRGGFGEVWKAEAPGGLLKAVKILHGNVFESGNEPSRIHQELKSLNRVRTIRHPYILSLERFEIIDGRLIIVTELADKSLWDRFQECRARSLPGIPRDELLRYMEETAEALDLMNCQFNLQHLDIKPQNLFLVFNHIKVGDFGLVKDLEGRRTRVSSGVTPVYAAPETFEGIVSRFCDQYNLAIAYQELLTGELPYDGTTGRQLMMQHLMGTPNLRPLPADDQLAVSRALAKKPEERFPSCMDFVQALRQPSEREESDGVTTPTPRPRALTRDGVRAESRPGSDTPNERLSPHTPEIVGPSRETPPAAKSARSVVLPTIPPPPPEQPETTGEGVLFPSLILGLGGLGREVQQQLRKSLRRRGGPKETWPHIRLLHLDTDPGALEQAVSGDPEAVLSPEEILVTFFHRPSHYLRRPRERQQLEEWLPLAPLARLPRDQVTAKGWRALGRLAFVSCASTITGRLREELEACSRPETLTATAERTGLGLRTTRPRVYVVTGLTGGSGSGMFLDVAYAVRQTLVQLGFPRAEVVGVLLVPPIERSGSPRAVANTFAALTELNHFASSGGTGGGAQRPPFDRCLLLPLPPRTDGVAGIGELAALAGDFLCRDLTTPLGRVADERRAELRLPSEKMLCQTFATYWFSVPRRPLLQRGAQSICDRVAASWQVNDRQAGNNYLESWVASQLKHSDLTPECLGAQLTETCAATLGQTPADYCSLLVERWAPGGMCDLGRRPAGIKDALAELQRLMGAPFHPIELDLPSPLVEALNGGFRTLAKQAEDRLGEVALRALAEPQIRLTGAEEAVQRLLWSALGEAARREKALSEERRLQARDIYARMPPLIDDLKRFGLLRWNARGRAAAGLVELFRDYLKARWDGTVARVVSHLCQDLQPKLHKYQRSVDCCRGRIRLFLKSFDDPSARAAAKGDLGLGRYLLPAGCRTLDEAHARLLDSLTREEEYELQQKVKSLIGETLQAHVHLCTAHPSVFKDLKVAIDREVERVAETSLGRAHAAELYMQQHAEDPAASADLAAAYDQAQPELLGSRQGLCQELSVLAVPPGPEGDHFRLLVRRALPDTPMLAAASTDDIVFYREHTRLVLTDLPQMGQAAREVYQQILAAEQLSPHSRTDLVGAFSEIARKDVVPLRS
jgi:serine/threonine protein kinase